MISREESSGKPKARKGLRLRVLALLLCMFVDALRYKVLAQASGTAADSTARARIDRGLGFEMESGPDPRVTLPRLVRFPDADVIKRVNADLSAEARRLSDEATRCDAGSEGKSSWEETARVDLLTRDVLSVYVGISYYCGGPHPDEVYNPLTYNLRTGKRFDFGRDASELFADQNASQKLVEMYRKHYGKDEGDCEASMIESDSRLFLHLAAEGLSVVPEVPHVMAACGPEIVIPYREIRSLVKHGNPFSDLISGEATVHKD